MVPAYTYRSSAARCGSALLGLYIVGLCLASGSALAQGLPTKEATCVGTRIKGLEHRLQSGPNGAFLPDSGSAVVYDNGAYQVSYDELPTVQRSRVGDAITLCLIRIPRGCPKGDIRGRIYTATNLRTLDSWTMADSEHSCGGA